MAISKLQPKSRWTEIASTSPTSGSSISFTSIPSYKELVLRWNGIVLATAAGQISITFNNDTGTNYASTSLANNSTPVTRTMFSTTTAIIAGFFKTVDPVSGYLKIDGANDIFKEVLFINANGTVDSDQQGRALGQGMWSEATTINRIDVTLSAGTFSSGNFKLYGRD